MTINLPVGVKPDPGIKGEPVDSWVHWGDSMTAAGSSGDWVSRFGTLHGKPYYNGGIGGETSSQIRARATASWADQYRNRKITIAAGRNNFTTSSVSDTVADIGAIIGHLTVNPVGFVFDVPPWVGETLPAAAGSNREKLETLNSAIQAAFPELYLPVFSMLRTVEAATAAGITWTPQDEANIAAGITPQSFRSDGGHLNPLGGRAVMYFVAKTAAVQGYTTATPVTPTDGIVIHDTK